MPSKASSEATRRVTVSSPMRSPTNTIRFLRGARRRSRRRLPAAAPCEAGGSRAQEHAQTRPWRMHLNMTSLKDAISPSGSRMAGAMMGESARRSRHRTAHLRGARENVQASYAQESKKAALWSPWRSPSHPPGGNSAPIRACKTPRALHGAASTSLQHICHLACGGDGQAPTRVALHTPPVLASGADVDDSPLAVHRGAHELEAMLMVGLAEAMTRRARWRGGGSRCSALQPSPCPHARPTSPQRSGDRQVRRPR